MAYVVQVMYAKPVTYIAGQCQKVYLVVKIQDVVVTMYVLLFLSIESNPWQFP